MKVHNGSHTDAERILVGVKFPAWVDIDNVNLTAGAKEITDGKDRARVVWNIDRIPAKGSQTITVTAVPRKAEVFDVGVEWAGQQLQLVAKSGAVTSAPHGDDVVLSAAGPYGVASNDCGEHGTFVNGICECSTGWAGERCAVCALDFYRDGGECKMRVGGTCRLDSCGCARNTAGQDCVPLGQCTYCLLYTSPSPRD